MCDKMLWWGSGRERQGQWPVTTTDSRDLPLQGTLGASVVHIR